MPIFVISSSTFAELCLVAIVDFRSKNIESIESLQNNSIDFYASVKSLYIQNRAQKIANSSVTNKSQDDSEWEEIDNQ